MRESTTHPSFLCLKGLDNSSFKVCLLQAGRPPSRRTLLRHLYQAKICVNWTIRWVAGIAWKFLRLSVEEEMCSYMLTWIKILSRSQMLQQVHTMRRMWNPKRRLLSCCSWAATGSCLLYWDSCLVEIVPGKTQDWNTESILWSFPWPRIVRFPVLRLFKASWLRIDSCCVHQKAFKLSTCLISSVCSTAQDLVNANCVWRDQTGFSSYSIESAFLIHSVPWTWMMCWTKIDKHFPVVSSGGISHSTHQLDDMLENCTCYCKCLHWQSTIAWVSRMLDAWKIVSLKRCRAYLFTAHAIRVLVLNLRYANQYVSLEFKISHKTLRGTDYENNPFMLQPQQVLCASCIKLCRLKSTQNKTDQHLLCVTCKESVKAVAKRRPVDGLLMRITRMTGTLADVATAAWNLHVYLVSQDLALECKACTEQQNRNFRLDRDWGSSDP